ncbi:MAG: GNAT family N-acetyltransferase [Polyangiales bacterium]
MTYTIRRAVPDDADALSAVFTDPSVIAGTLQLPYASPLLWRERLVAPDAPIMLVACDGRVIVGNLGLHTNARTPRRKHAASIGMGVVGAHQRKGVGSLLLGAVIDLADNWHGITRLELSVFTDNDGGVALYTKFGFVIEGTLRAYALRNGAYADAYSMARLRPMG